MSQKSTGRGLEKTIEEVLARYPISVASVSPIHIGHINLTLIVHTNDGPSYVLQRVSSIFGPQVNLNIERAVNHLHDCGLITPMLVRDRDERVEVVLDGERWRLLTFIEGRCYETVKSLNMAAAAGGLLGRFHNALSSLDGELIQSRPQVHDYGRHRTHLQDALNEYRDHRLWSKINEFAAPLLQQHHPLRFESATVSTVHGDPKISNVIFGRLDSDARCFVDLDTLGDMPIIFELGDALRSWCNAAGEDSAQAEFDGDIFLAATSAYLDEAFSMLSDEDVDAVIPATLQIHYELASRFLADALEESYFGWDENRFESRGEHNLARAAAQLQAAASLEEQRVELQRQLSNIR